ncbi:MAG: PhnD/SsuA/transferrin family substrate-binding protein [Pirellulales bacterium]|nr:PhnD/SsuA/transferrin family substrate-binding protein [Pirellulales bacterium]
MRYPSVLAACVVCLRMSSATWAEGDATKAVRATKADQANVDSNTISLVVLDPLAEPLSCPCVAGYAQRKYEKLADYLSKRTGRGVAVTFAESFEKALAKDGCKQIDLAIGKDSVVRHDAAAKKMTVTPLARLTGQDGKTTQTGLIVVRSADPAKVPSDLRGYRILFGPRECDEKFAAARNALLAAGVEVPAAEDSETTDACSDGATKIIEWGESQRAAAVISSYAAPLLEGCGTIKKGDLRVVGETREVPFVTAFATNHVAEPLRAEIREALLAVGSDVALKEALESLLGFVEIDEAYQQERREEGAPTQLKTKQDRVSAPSDGDSKAPAGNGEAGDGTATGKAASTWPGWRGPNRDGRVPRLPLELPAEAKIVWRQPMNLAGLGGIAATDELVIVGDRDVANSSDEFRCYAAGDGELLWTYRYAAPGALDYDNVPRATPLVYDGNVYLFGAFGDLACVDALTGIKLWGMNVISEFDGDSELVWGTCTSPLVVDAKLIVNPGGPEASVVALDPATGEVLWKSPGDRHAYSSFIVATLGGSRQLIGYDRSSLGGWAIETGMRLWTLRPPHEGDFNVPTPVVAGEHLLVVTENNFARLYGFDPQGRIIPEPLALNKELGPDISTPVVVGNRAFCVWESMYCLDLANGLKTIWVGEDDAFGEFAHLMASNNRVLAMGIGGELLLIDAEADRFRVISRLHVFEDAKTRDTLLHSHPALVGYRLYLRGENELVCVDLTPPKP